jgi:hypothetical protein
MAVSLFLSRRRMIYRKRSSIHTALKFGDNGILIQLLCFWTLSIVLFLLKTHASETGFCLCLQVEPPQLGPIDRASPYLRTPAPTQDRILSRVSVTSRRGLDWWVHNQAQHKPSARVKTSIKNVMLVPYRELISLVITSVLVIFWFNYNSHETVHGHWC